MRTLATSRMGRYGVAKSFPNETLPVIAPIRPSIDWMPNAVDLREGGGGGGGRMGGGDEGEGGRRGGGGGREGGRMWQVAIYIV